MSLLKDMKVNHSNTRQCSKYKIVYDCREPVKENKYSQSGQDQFAYNISGSNGLYLEIGAHHPIINSNTFFETNGSEIVLDLDNEQRLFKTKCMNIYQSEKKNLKYIKLKQECFRPLVNYDYSSPPHEGVVFYIKYSLFSWHPRVDENSPIEICDEIKNSEIFNK